jgi:hypothetical protein
MQVVLLPDAPLHLLQRALPLCHLAAGEGDVAQAECQRHAQCANGQQCHTARADECLIVIVLPPLHGLALGELRATPPLQSLTLVELHGCEEEKLTHVYCLQLRDVA